MTDVLAFFVIVLVAFATAETAPTKGAVVTRADNVAYLPPVAP